MTETVLLHARQLYTCAGPAPRVGVAQGDAGLVSDGAVTIRGHRITAAGRKQLVAEEKDFKRSVAATTLVLEGTGE